jgi:hypothetical protein
MTKERLTEHVAPSSPSAASMLGKPMATPRPPTMRRPVTRHVEPSGSWRSRE